jgi:carbon-monoxide dehydrogenase medium subunit
VCVAVGAKMVIRNRRGERILSMGEFHRGPCRTAVGAAELLREIRVPPRENAGSALFAHAAHGAQHREEER